MEDQTYIIVQGLNLSTGGDWMDDALQGIGQRIREARSACGMTQSELADRCNVSQTFLSRVENGKQAMNIRLLLSISDTQMGYITNVGFGQGLLKVGSSLVPFVNKFPNDTKLYKLMTTKPNE